MEIKIYIPSYSKKYLNEIIPEILKLSNGLTVFPKLKGLWLNPESKKIESDNITLISVLIDDSVFQNWLLIQKTLYNIAHKIKEDLKQNSVLIQINDKPRFY